MSSLSYMDEASNYYIHLHKRNIGTRASGGVIDFKKQKELAANQLKSNYAGLLKDNFNSKIPEGLGDALDIKEEEFITTLNNQLKNNLQKALATDKLYQLHNYAGDLQKAISSSFDGDKLKDFSDALDIIAKCVSLMDGGDALGAILLNAKKHGGNSKALGKALNRELKAFEVNNNLSTFSKESLISAKAQLDNLAFALNKGYFKSGKTLSESGLTTLLLNGLVSTQIAEGLGFMIANETRGILSNAIVESVGSKATLSGDIFFNKNKKMYGKADILLKNVQMSLEGSGQEINLNLGISSKFYKNQGFRTSKGGKVKSNKKGAFHSGSGWTLGAALHTVFSGDRERYLAYNYMVHNLHTMEMNDVIATRQLLRLFSSMGVSEDFAMFMLVNGELVSIWDMVQYAVSNSLSLSQSMAKGSDQAIVLTIPDRTKIMEKTKIKEKGLSLEELAWKRSRLKNAQINKARIYAELRIDKLAMAMSKT